MPEFAFTSVQQASDELLRFVPRADLGANYTLGRMRQLMAALGNPQDRLRVVHAAGTSGKTSTCYFIRAMLQAAGAKTGLTVSPHITSITERVQVNGRPLPDAKFVAYINEFMPLVVASNLHPTYFELMMAFAYWVFARQKVDYAVVETGVGGLLDGSNVVTRADKLCLLGDIGLDHTQILGNTLPQIAAQKAGIIQPGNHVIAQLQGAEVCAAFEQATLRQGAILQYAAAGKTPDLPEFQQRNWRLAFAGYEYLRRRDKLLKLSAAQLTTAARQTPPARMEEFSVAGKTVMIDGAHNPQKMQALVQALQTRGQGRVPVLASFLEGPDLKIDGILQALAPITSQLFVTSFQVSQDLQRRSVPTAELASKAHAAGILDVEVYQDLSQAVAALLDRPEPLLLITGSLYLASQARPIVQAVQRRG